LRAQTRSPYLETGQCVTDRDMHCVISLLSLPDSTRANDLMGKNFVATETLHE
jgi:hypothetical protein